MYLYYINLKIINCIESYGNISKLVSCFCVI